MEIANKHGSCIFTIELVVIDKPSAPENLKVTNVMETAVFVQWEEPRDDGGAHVFNYVIEKKEGIKIDFYSLLRYKIPDIDVLLL